VITLKVPNTNIADMQLPSTGGPGSAHFYISGGLMLLLAAGIYVFGFHRRKGGKRRPEPL